jgi:lipoic acid synthetase
MLLGDVCTRGCRFCAVTSGDPRGFVDTREPEHVARAIARLSLQYVVMTMVNRDDLLDGGADHVRRTVQRLKDLRPDILVETLVGDFSGHLSSVDVVVDSGIDVFAHNVETIRRLTRTVRDARSSYDQSLAVLGQAKKHAHARGLSGQLTKSSIMVGVGETDDEVLETMRDLRGVGVDVVTVGQYLRPTPKHLEVARFVPPETFVMYEREALTMGFVYVASGPLVRSSYRAAEVFLRGILRAGGGHRADGDGVQAALDARMDVAKRESRRVAAEMGDETVPPLAKSEEAGVSGLVPAASLVRR